MEAAYPNPDGLSENKNTMLKSYKTVERTLSSVFEKQLRDSLR